jgi:hypothetical protein
VLLLGFCAKVGLTFFKCPTIAKPQTVSCDLNERQIMGTFSQTFIKTTKIDEIIKILNKSLNLGLSELLNERFDWYYWRDNRNNKTIIISNNLSVEWTEIEFDFNGNMYLYDELIKILTKELGTIALLGFYQSTSGEGRIAKFDKGQLKYTYYERYFEYDKVSRIYLADNWNINESKIGMLKERKLDQDSSIIDHDLINSFYKSEGFEYNSNKKYEEWAYLHVEQIK